MSFNEEQMAQFIADVKSMATTNPSKATELFKASPQLSYIIVQAMLSLRMIDNNTILSLVDRQDMPADQTAPQPTEYAEQPAAAKPSSADPQQLELIRQVMQLTEEQIAALPPDHRNTLNALRERVLSGEIQI